MAEPPYCSITERDIITMRTGMSTRFDTSLTRSLSILPGITKENSNYYNYSVLERTYDITQTLSPINKRKYYHGYVELVVACSSVMCACL